MFDIIGKVRKDLVNIVKRAGTHHINFKYDNLSSGTYFISLWTGRKAVAERMVILK